MNTKGFTLFFAMLVGALALAVGLAIYDLTIRELDLSAAATQSQYAIYAADTGAECALYWDSKYVNGATNNNGGSNSAFATSSLDTLKAASGSGVLCNGYDISTSWTFPTPPAPNPAPISATTTFTVSIPNAPSNPTQTYCAVVTIAKSGNPPVYTIISNGFNTCTAGALQLERTLQVSNH